MVQLEYLTPEILTYLKEVRVELCNWQGRLCDRIERVWVFESDKSEFNG